MFSLLFVSLISWSLVAALPASLSANSSDYWTDNVDLGYSVVRGVKQGGLNYFTGIRYGTAERYQLPHVPATNRTLHDAVQQPSQCWQAPSGSGKGSSSSTSGSYNGSEDCLFLNVIAPESAQPGSNYPVVVWIHGGGYQTGSISAFNFSGLATASQNAGQPIVVVSIQYRLGAFGFLPGSEIYDNGILNAGLVDQEFALLWVQRHIYYFGGDRSHVVIWGESAGAGSVNDQVLAHGGNTAGALGLDQGLFCGAIVSSGSMHSEYEYNAPEAEALYSNVLNATGCGDYACLAALDASTLNAAAVKVSSAAPFGAYSYLPVVDGSFLTDLWTTLVAEKKYNVDKILGLSNYDEGYVFTDPALRTSNVNQTDQELDNAFEQFLVELYPRLSSDQRQTVLEQVPISDFPRANNTFLRAETVTGMTTYVCPTYNLAQGAQMGYYGQFVAGKALHGADVALYGRANLTATASESLVDSFTGAILGFITTYDPNNNPLDRQINPYWPKIGDGEVLVFNTTVGTPLGQATPGLQPVNSHIAPDFSKGRIDQCSFWLGPIAEGIPN